MRISLGSSQCCSQWRKYTLMTFFWLPDSSNGRKLEIILCGPMTLTSKTFAICSGGTIIVLFEYDPLVAALLIRTSSPWAPSFVLISSAALRTLSVLSTEAMMGTTRSGFLSMRACRAVDELLRVRAKILPTWETGSSSSCLTSSSPMPRDAPVIR